MAVTRRSLVPSTLVLPAVLLLVFYGAGNAYCSVVSDNTTDRQSLLDFRKATKDPKGALRSWNDNIHHCLWLGVDCGTRHPERVAVLNLSDLSLAGEIAPFLGNLTFLGQLDLSSNRFSGQLPPLNHLRKSEILDLGDNLLQENIPDALIALANCSQLLWLDLSANMLVGSIPRNISSLSNLMVMDLSKNNLTGNIPPTFSNITYLDGISLTDNHLEGSIPEELGQLPHIRWLDLGANKLSGRVPPSIGALKDLGYLILGGNNFVGPIAYSIGNLSNLVKLNLSNNQFDSW